MELCPSGSPNDPPPWTNFSKSYASYGMNPTVTLDIVNNLFNRYEVMSLAAESWTTALGATPAYCTWSGMSTSGAVHPLGFGRLMHRIQVLQMVNTFTIVQSSAVVIGSSRATGTSSSGLKDSILSEHESSSFNHPDGFRGTSAVALTCSFGRGERRSSKSLSATEATPELSTQNVSDRHIHSSPVRASRSRLANRMTMAPGTLGQPKSDRIREALSKYNDQPIAFYGRLVDQFGEPVSSAVVDFVVREINGRRDHNKGSQKGQITPSGPSGHRHATLMPSWRWKPTGRRGSPTTPVRQLIRSAQTTWTCGPAGSTRWKASR